MSEQLIGILKINDENLMINMGNILVIVTTNQDTASIYKGYEVAAMNEGLPLVLFYSPSLDNVSFQPFADFLPFDIFIEGMVRKALKRISLDKEVDQP